MNQQKRIDDNVSPVTVVTVTSCSLLFASPRRDRGGKPGVDTSVHCCDLDEIQSLPVSNVEIQVFVLFGSWGSIPLFDTKWPPLVGPSDFHFVPLPQQ